MNAVFIHIPRTAGRSIMDALDIMQYKKELEKGYKYDGLISFGHYPIWYVIQDGFFKPDGWYVFAFVRNPYDRFVSLYEFNKSMSYFSGSFREFCHGFDELGYSVKARQTDYLIGAQPDFIGRYEHLFDDFVKLCGVLGIKDKKLPRIGAIDRKHWQTYYDKELADIVYEHYKKDFKAFGYGRM